MLTVRTFIFSMMSSVAADIATTPTRFADFTVNAEALNALTGAPYATWIRSEWVGTVSDGGRCVAFRRRSMSSEKDARACAAASGVNKRGDLTNLGGSLGGDGGLHAEGRGHGGHGRHGNVGVC